MYPNGVMNSYGNTRQTVSYIRLLHASPGAPAVDVYANNSLIARNLAYRGFTEYMQILPGRYHVVIFPTGTTGPALVDTEVEVPFKSIITAAVIGIAPNVGIKAFFEPVLQIPQGMLYLRFSNLVPDSPELDLALSNGTMLFEGVSYGAATNYIAVYPGDYTFTLQQSGTGRRLLYVPNIHLLPGRFYTVYAVGQVAGNTPLQVLIPLDGNSYIKLQL